MPGTHLSEAEIAQAIELFRAGMSIKKIADRLGRAEERISHHLKRAGVWEGKTARFTTNQIQEMLHMLDANLSLQAIGQAFGVSYNSIYHALRRHGYDTRVLMRHLEHQRAVDLSHVPELWWAEFRGFFYGEGSVSLAERSQGNGAAIRLQIMLRDDDAEALRHVQEMLGGALRYNIPHRRSRNANPNCVWAVTGLSNCLGILERLDGGWIPAKKRGDIALGIEYCRWRLDCPRHLTEAQHTVQSEYVRRLREVKVYRTY